MLEKVKHVPLLETALAGAAISLGTILSALTAHSLISPLIFSVGILLCIDCGLCLITRDVPLNGLRWEAAVILAVNCLSAIVIGVLASKTLSLSVPVLEGKFFEAVLTGIIIGCVAAENKRGGRYAVISTMILMWAFVYCKLPHVVVYAFWGAFGAVTISMLLRVAAGNIVGGLVIWAAGKARKTGSQ